MTPSTPEFQQRFSKVCTGDMCEKKKIKKCIFITQQIHRGPSFMEAEVKFVKQLIV